MKTPPVVLSIAGFDGTAGAGVLADLKTISALGGYGVAVVTAFAVQSTREVVQVAPVAPNLLQSQLQVLTSDISPQAIKIGMLANKAAADVVVAWLKVSPHASCPLVCDPVLRSGHGEPLSTREVLPFLLEELLPLATLLTPNIPEACHLLGRDIPEEVPLPMMEEMAYALQALGARSVLLKGGHLRSSENAWDFLLEEGGKGQWFEGKRLLTRNHHGTGCTLSSAIATFLAQENSLKKSCEMAKNYIQGALLGAQTWTLGQGSGPLNHFFILK